MDSQAPTSPVVREVGRGESSAPATQGSEGGSPRRRGFRRRSPRRYPKRIRGLRLATKLMLVGLPLALVFVPWLSFALLDEMEQAFVQLQSNQQRGVAENIATVLKVQGELSDLPATPNETDLVAHRIARPVWLNAYASEWGDEALVPSRFGSPGDASFLLSLGTREDMLFAYMEITDDIRVYRDSDVLRLDNADQVRITFTTADGLEGRIAVTLSESGDTTAYRMDSDWSFAEDTGAPLNDVRGRVRETDGGYALEMRLPLDLLGSERSFAMSFVDVDDPVDRAARAVTTTAPSQADGSRLVVVRSPELLEKLGGLGYSRMRIRIFDAQKKERADRGRYRVDDWSTPSPAWFAAILMWLDIVRDQAAGIRDWVWQRLTGEQWSAPVAGPDAQGIEEQVIDAALAGESIALRRRVGDIETILAGHPIRDGEQVIGMIAVEQNIDDILLFLRQALDEIAVVAVLSFVVVLVSLVLFAGRLTWRIRSLRREVTAAIDDYGRLRATALTGGMSAGDEIGDLARGVSNMLARLDQHNTFLQKMPRTLRHEINNPLNTVMTSLDQLAREVSEVAESKYLDSARRGILRIGAIVQNLADAANLEESLASEDVDIVDIHALMDSYVTNCRTVHKSHSFVFRAPPGPILADVADYRIEQMLDKLIDNAIDFHRANSPITIELHVHRDTMQITVANRGPMLPPDVAGSLFGSMVSRRASANELHFGLGLYVVRVIAEQHGGSVRAMNLLDGSGVAVMVRLPLAQVSPPATDRQEPVAAGR
ncbi:MAG: ATP-binding protein [Gammaproteobacteria bacterium]|nr:ATP-binding protein [Gammaproteobacteria bacterium]